MTQSGQNGKEKSMASAKYLYYFSREASSVLDHIFVPSANAVRAMYALVTLAEQ